MKSTNLIIVLLSKIRDSIVWSPENVLLLVRVWWNQQWEMSAGRGYGKVNSSACNDTPWCVISRTDEAWRQDEEDVTSGSDGRDMWHLREWVMTSNLEWRDGGEGKEMWHLREWVMRSDLEWSDGGEGKEMWHLREWVMTSDWGWREGEWHLRVREREMASEREGRDVRAEVRLGVSVRERRYQRVSEGRNTSCPPPPHALPSPCYTFYTLLYIFRYFHAPLLSCWWIHRKCYLGL